MLDSKFLEYIDKMHSRHNNKDRNDMYTSPKLVEESLDIFPHLYWFDPHKTWCNPYTKNGIWLAHICLRLMEGLKGWEKDDEKRYNHIKNNMLFGYNKQKRNKYRLNKLFNGSTENEYKNIFNEDFLESMRKFDVIIGNPPYQNANSNGNKIWPKFITYSMELLEDDGILLLLTPKTWINASGSSMSKLQNKMLENDISFIDNDVNEYFSVESDIGYFMMNKSPYKGKTKIKDNDKEYIIELKNGNNPLSEEEIFIDNICSKMENYGNKIEYDKVSTKISRLTNMSKNVLKKEDAVSFEKNDEYKYTIQYTPATQIFAKNIEIEKTFYPKVILSSQGDYYNEKHPDKNIFITDNILQGLGTLSIKCKNINQCKNVKKYLISKLYIFFVGQKKINGFHAFVCKMLPKLNPDIKWNDQEIYKEFNLSEEEIKYVEKSV